MEYTVTFKQIETLIVLDALNVLSNSKTTHEDDKRMAREITAKIKEVVKMAHRHYMGKIEPGTMICSECGRPFEAGNRPDGLPNGIGYQMEDGTIINVCTDCIIKMGQERENEGL